MQDFIVLGIIPGTSIQATFQFWMAVALGIVTLIGIIRLYRRRHAIRAYLAARKINRFITRSQIQAQTQA